jgi:hypothetical protein
MDATIMDQSWEVRIKRMQVVELRAGAHWQGERSNDEFAGNSTRRFFDHWR